MHLIPHRRFDLLSLVSAVDGEDVAGLTKKHDLAEDKISTIQNSILGKENTLARLTVQHGFGPREVVVMRRYFDSNKMTDNLIQEQGLDVGVGLVLDYTSEACIVRFEQFINKNNY
jgi:hypothetical protein